MIEKRIVVIKMSDDFAICPKCKVLDASFHNLKNGQRECIDCGWIGKEEEIGWKHFEYSHGKIIND